MQNVQNAAEIQQRVINLVELYRTKAGKESQMAKDLAEEYKHQYDNEMDIAMYLHEQGTNHYALNIDFTEEEIDSLRVNQQLLGHFYKEHAGNDANPQVLAELLNEKYDSNVFTAEEESFLLKHFKEMVNYIIQTPNNDLSAINVIERMDFYLIPSEVLDLIKSRVKIPTGSKIYNPFTGFAQLACMYPDCSFVCEESYIPYNKRWNKYCDWSRKEANVIHNKIVEHKLYAWMKVALYANEVDVKESVEDFAEGKYDIAMTFIPWIPNAIPNNAYGYTGEARNDKEISDKICNTYRNLRDGGIMVLLLPNEHLYGNIALNSLWNVIHNENSLKEIIQLPPVMGGHLHKDCCIVIAEKGRKDKNVIFTDARYAFDKTENKNFKGRLDLSTFSEMMQNGGIEGETGLRKSIQVPSSSANPALLIPQVYVVETPSENEKPVPLSSLCQLVTERVKDVKYDLPLDTPLVTAANLDTTFKGTLDIEKVGKANCPNNPPHTEEYTFDKNGNFIDDPIHYIFGEGTANSKSSQVAEYRQCVFLDGSKHAVLFALTKDGLKTALYEPLGKPVAIETNPSLSNQHFYVILPKDGIDALSLLAILRLPVVYRQLQAYEEFGLYGQNGHLKDIIVPNDKRLIIDEINRMLNEQDVVGNLEDCLYHMKRAVRMRKHALTQSLSSLEAMFYALNAYRERKDGHIADDDVISRVKGTTVRDAFEYLSKGLKGMMPVLEHIADVEYTFAKSEWIDPELFIEDYIARMEKGWLNFKPVITWEKGDNQAKSDGYAFTNTQPSQKVLALKKGQSIRQFLFPKDALEHIFKNIISNAQSWAFNDKSREDYQLKFSWHIGGEGKTLVIEIENNGTPIPEDRDTASLLEYGVSTALHRDGHNGIGCNEIDDIMQRYDGKVEIVSTPQSTFTVKYVLTFNHIDDMGSKYKVIKPVM